MPPKTLPKTPDVNVMSNGSVYLVFYNVFLSLGWLIVLIQTLHHMLHEGGSLTGLWESTSSVLKIFQSLAILEVVHAAVGLVPSSVAMVIPQVTSRLVILWPVLCMVNNTHTSIGLPMLLFAWSVTEVIRYAYYFLGILKHENPKLTFLRYTLFIVLYPIGVTGELLCLYAALPTVAKTKAYSIAMPNVFNFTFDLHSILIIFALLYVPVFPKLYLHMFAQRKKVLGKKKKAD